MRLTLSALPFLLGACATAQGIELPERPVTARLGSEVLAQIQGLSVADRETYLLHEFTSGNVPAFLRTFVPIVVTRADTTGQVRTIRYEVTADYLAIGADHDFFRQPMSPTLGQRLADLFDCSLPTRRIVDDVWNAAPVQLDPVTFSPTVYDILSPALFLQHHTRIEQQRLAHPAGALGTLVAGIKKDVVVTPRLATLSNRVAIYGWHRQNGVAIQPLYTGHVDFYADYSHGIRLVKNRVSVDGLETTVAAVLAHPILHPLLSDEGAFAGSRYPQPAQTAAAREAFPYIDRIPASGRQLASWRAKFTQPRVVPLVPPPSHHLPSDGFGLAVFDPAGGTDSIRVGHPSVRDQVVEADLYCEYRPQLAGDGFERIGVFARDQARGAFDGTLSQNGACYALAWDSHDGRLWCKRMSNGTRVDLAPAPIYLRSSGWRRLRIEARGAQLRFLVDGVEVAAATDTTFAHGECGIGHHEFFVTNANVRGARCDNFFSDVPDGLLLRLDDTRSTQLTMSLRRGVPGDLYFAPITLTQGSFPNGWFYGLDPTLAELGSALASAHPAFVGFFDAAGNGGGVLAPLPAGLEVFATGLDVYRLLPPIAVAVPARATIRP